MKYIKENHKFYLKFALAALAVTAAVSVQAAPITYIGYDNNVSSLAGMTNSVATAASFDTAVPGASLITFETPLPSDVTIVGGSIINHSICGALCGFNTTPGGSK